MRQIDALFSTAPAGPLYHYTGFDSLVGMQKSKEIWASSIHYMNDEMELVSGCDAGEGMLAPLLAFGTDNEQKKFAFELVQWISELRGDTERTVFVFSLSEAPSLLSQWRSYTPHGEGISISFSADKLKIMCRSSDMRLGKCVYEPGAQQDLLKDLFEKLWETASQSPLNGDHHAPISPYTSFFDMFANDIIQVMALIKHSSFKEEQEWRLISRLHQNLHDCHVRLGKSMFVPYLPIPLGLQQPLFGELVLGPTPHQKLSMASLRAFLEINKLSDDLRHCGIPYREW